MMGRAKILTVVALAVLATSAVAASGAQAEGKWTAGVYPAKYTGVQLNEQVLRIKAGVREIKCASVTFFSANLAGPMTTLTITPTYKNCTTVPGNLPATVTMEGCDFTVHLGEVHNMGTLGTATTSIDCPAEEEIDVATYPSGVPHEPSKATCTFGIPAQGPLGEIQSHLKNGGMANQDLEWTFNVQKIKVNGIKGSSIICGIGAGQNGLGTYTGKMTVTADVVAEGEPPTKAGME